MGHHHSARACGVLSSVARRPRHGLAKHMLDSCCAPFLRAHVSSAPQPGGQLAQGALRCPQSAQCWSQSPDWCCASAAQAWRCWRRWRRGLCCAPESVHVPQPAELPDAGCGSPSSCLGAQTVVRLRQMPWHAGVQRRRRGDCVAAWVGCHTAPRHHHQGCRLPQRRLQCCAACEPAGLGAQGEAQRQGEAAMTRQSRRRCRSWHVARLGRRPVGH